MSINFHSQAIRLFLFITSSLFASTLYAGPFSNEGGTVQPKIYDTYNTRSANSSHTTYLPSLQHEHNLLKNLVETAAVKERAKSKKLDNSTEVEKTKEKFKPVTFDSLAKTNMAGIMFLGFERDDFMSDLQSPGKRSITPPLTDVTEAAIKKDGNVRSSQRNNTLSIFKPSIKEVINKVKNTADRYGYDQDQESNNNRNTRLSIQHKNTSYSPRFSINQNIAGNYSSSYSSRLSDNGFMSLDSPRPKGKAQPKQEGNSEAKNKVVTVMLVIKKVLFSWQFWLFIAFIIFIADAVRR